MPSTFYIYQPKANGPLPYVKSCKTFQRIAAPMIIAIKKISALLLRSLYRIDAVSTSHKASIVIPMGRHSVYSSHSLESGVQSGIKNTKAKRSQYRLIPP